MDNEQYISAFKIAKQFNITSGTLRRWAEDGKIRYLRPNVNNGRGGKRIYNIEDIKKIFGINDQRLLQKPTICYARVSSTHQKEDLERQVNLLKEQYPNATILKDIGSGLNWNRPGFKSLLEQVYSRNVQEVVVTYKDRMCRFGFELIEWIFKKSGVKLVVLSKSAEHEELSKELSEDLLAITTVFVAKNNGIRASKYKQDRKRQEEIKRNQKNQQLN
ncbi:IS607 family transposase [bacterium]|nr:IS607 family transposase [bacterium]NDD84766.1 IS607 family transposase [bacterium]